MDNTKIEWADATWTPIRARLWQIQSDGSGKERVGWHCEHVSEGCRNCYSERMNQRLGTGEPFKPGVLRGRKGYYGGGKDRPELFLDEKMLAQPLRWKKPRRVFVCSMTDLFADFVPDDWIDRIFAVMALAPQHQFLVLTKRSTKMRDYITARAWDMPTILSEAVYPAPTASGPSWPLHNVWLGVSVEDQTRADERIPDLLATPAAVRWVSAEPLLSAVDFSPWLPYNPVHEQDKAQRGIRLSGGSERRSGNPSERNDLASPQTRLGSLEEASGEPAVQTGEGRARRRGVSANPSDDRRGEGLRAGGAAGLPAFSRPDTGRSDGEPRGRQEEEQSSRQFYAGDTFGTDSPCGPRSQDRASGQSIRDQESRRKIDDRSDHDDQEKTSERRETGADSGGFRGHFSGRIEDREGRPQISWLVCGGESGPNARPMHPDWARSIRDQCAAAGVPFFFKQWGGWKPWAPGDGDVLIEHVSAQDGMRFSEPSGIKQNGGPRSDTDPMSCVGKKRAGALLDGKEHRDWPA